MNRTPATTSRFLLLGIAVVIATACSVRLSPSETPAATPNASATPTSEAPGPTVAPPSEPSPATAVKVYFVVFQGSDESPPILAAVHREIAPTVGVGRAAMTALLAGPTDEERAHNLVLGTVGTMIHPDTRLLGIEIVDGTAIVDLSQEFLPLDVDEGNIDEYVLTLAQVTYTLTQFPTVDRVTFHVEGQLHPAIEGHEGTPQLVVGREAYLDQLPPIFLDQPAWGANLTDPVRISGRAQLFGAQFQAALVDGATGEVLVERTVLVDCGGVACSPPGGGEFSAELPVPATAFGSDIHVRVWEPSPSDGSPTSVVEYPLR